MQAIAKFEKTERAAYRVLDPVGFFGPDDTLHAEGSEIYYDGVPNELMEPLNALAHERMVNYLEALDELGRKAAEKAGRPFSGRPRSLDGALSIATAIQEANKSVMGDKNKAVVAIAPVDNQVAETGKRGRGRPRKEPSLAQTANAA
jgi:hypothetical protein